MSQAMTGGCICGKIRYESAGAPTFSANCHCRDCQRAGGGAYWPVMFVPAETFRFVQGEPKFHSVKSNSGELTHRFFCTDCGAPLVVKVDRNPKSVGILAANLDDPSVYKPTVDGYTASAQPWDYMNPDLKKR